MRGADPGSGGGREAPSRRRGAGHAFSDLERVELDAALADPVVDQIARAVSVAEPEAGRAKPREFETRREIGRSRGAGPGEVAMSGGTRGGPSVAARDVG